MTIWKYELEITDEQTLVMPQGAKFLSAQNQNEKACLWAMVEPSNAKEVRRLHLFGTGHPVPADASMEHLGTFPLKGGELIFHLFEVTSTVAT